MVDLAFFVVILMVFIIAYGVASQVILYPNSDFGLELLRDVFKKPYFQMYGELFLEEIEGTHTLKILFQLCYQLRLKWRFCDLKNTNGKIHDVYVVTVASFRSLCASRELKNY